MKLSAAAGAALLAACGSSPKLTSLRCQAACQSAEDPFQLKLAVDFADPTGTLSTGVVTVKVNTTTQAVLQLSSVFKASGVDPAATSGTLRLSPDVVLQTVQAGQTFDVSIVATDGDGAGSNEPKLTLGISL